MKHLFIEASSALKSYLCFDFSAWEYRCHSFPSSTTTPFPTPWMNENLVNQRQNPQKLYYHILSILSNHPKDIIEAKDTTMNYFTEHTRRFLGLPNSRFREALIRSTHIWHVCRSLWQNVYTASTQREDWVFDLWKPCTVKRYICIGVNKFSISWDNSQMWTKTA